MRVFGRIEDAYTEKPLPGAIVTLRVGDTELIEHTPAREGHFDYEIPDEAIPIDEDVLTCTVEKRGYKTQTTTYGITDEIELAVELVPHLVDWKRIFTVSGIILGGLILLALIIFGVKYFFFGPKEYPIKTFTVKPVKIKAGDQAEIKWETVDAEAVFLGDEKVEDSDKVDLTGTQTVSPVKTRKYYLTVKDADGKKQLAQEWLEIEVIPPPPVILSFTAKPMEINLWDSAVLEWKTTNTEEIYILSDPEDKNLRIDVKKIHRDQAIINEDSPEEGELEPPEKKKELNGAIEVFPLETTTFTLVAVNSEGVKREESIKVRVLVAPEILSFTTTNRTIDPGESVILTWDTREAEQVFLNGERTGPRFSREVRPNETTTYKLTAKNQVGERNCTLTVTVRCPDLPEEKALPLKPPRIYRFHISSAVIAPGESTVLTWVTDYAEKVYLTIKPVGITMPTTDATAITGEIIEDIDKNKETETDAKAKTGTKTAPEREIIAGKPLETGEVIRVKPVDSLQVSPQVSTRYQLRAVNPLKEVSWTRTVEVKPHTCTVIFYELENYKGEFMRFTTGAADLGEMNNRVSSIKIIGSCGVKVYSAPDFKATHQEFLSSVPRLRGTWIGNNTISSFKIIDHSGAEK